MTSYKKVKLKDLVKIRGGKRLPKGSTLTNVKTQHPYIRVRDINMNSINTDNLEFVTEKTFPKIQRYIVSEGDIILSIVGSIGQVSKIQKVLDKASLTENCVKLTNYKKDIIDPDFLFYYLASPLGQHQINSRTVGSTQPKLPIYNIESIPISLPPLPEQKRISSILSSFDNKIEQLKKENNILEDIAQNIFKEWFVKYNFPNKDGKPYKDNKGRMIDSKLGLIPEGWRVGKLGDIAELQSGFAFQGGNFKEKSNTKVVKIKDLKGQGEVDITNLSCVDDNIITEKRTKHFLLSEGDILIAMSGNTTGKIGIMPYTEFPVYLNQRVGKLFFKNKDYYNYVYSFLMVNNYEERILNMGYGSAQPNINPTQIGNIEILRPSSSLLNFYNQKTNVIYQKERNNTKNIIILAKSKNALLNKLI